MAQRTTSVPLAGRTGIQGRNQPQAGGSAAEDAGAARRQELVSLRIDRDVLDFFQEDGPGWQERINAALRKVAGK